MKSREKKEASRVELTPNYPKKIHLTIFSARVEKGIVIHRGMETTADVGSSINRKYIFCFTASIRTNFDDDWAL
jgi:hypothetical protein